MKSEKLFHRTEIFGDSGVQKLQGFPAFLQPKQPGGHGNEGARTAVEAVAYSKKVAEAMHQYIQSSLY